MGRIKVVFSLRLFRVLRCLNLFSLVRFISAIVFHLCIPIYKKLSPVFSLCLCMGSDDHLSKCLLCCYA